MDFCPGGNEVGTVIALKIATHFHRLGWRASDMDDSCEYGNPGEAAYSRMDSRPTPSRGQALCGNDRPFSNCMNNPG